MNFSKRIIMVFCLFVSSVTFGELSADSMFTPEMIKKIKYGNSFIDLTDGLQSGKIDTGAFLAVAENLQVQQIAVQEYNDLTLCAGNWFAIPFASGFRIGTGTCEASVYFAGYGFNPIVSTKKLLIATAVAVALTVAYKKGYFGAIKNYFTKSSENDEDEQSA